MLLFKGFLFLYFFFSLDSVGSYDKQSCIFYIFLVDVLSRKYDHLLSLIFISCRTGFYVYISSALLSITIYF